MIAEAIPKSDLLRQMLLARRNGRPFTLPFFVRGGRRRAWGEPSYSQLLAVPPVRTATAVHRFRHREGSLRLEVRPETSLWMWTQFHVVLLLNCVRHTTVAFSM